MYPTKHDNIDIQTEISSQFGFKTVNLTIQSDISGTITKICTKNTTDRGSWYNRRNKKHVKQNPVL